MTIITSRARPRKTTRAPVIALLLRYCARRDSTRPSTCATMLRSPRASGRASTFFAVHAVPRSSALPTAPGARSWSGTATSPTSESTASPSRWTGMMRLSSGPRRKTTESTESSEKKNHWNQPAVWGLSRTARPTAIAESPKKKTKKAPGVNASDASSASPSTSHSHHDIGRGVYSPTAAGSSREQPSILGARTGPGQHTQQEDEPRYPEQVRPDRGGRHEEVETSGEREEDGEDVPVARGERREHPVEEPVLPARHAPAARLRRVAPADHCERTQDAHEQRRQQRPPRGVARAGDAAGDPCQDRDVHDRVPRHVEPVAEARLGEAEARELAVRAVEHPRDLEQDHRRHHRRHAGHAEKEAPCDPERDAGHRDGVRRDGRAEEETGERPRQVAEEAVQVAVTRVLEGAQEGLLEPGAPRAPERSGAGAKPWPAVLGNQRSRRNPHARAVRFDLEHLPGSGARLEVAHQGRIDDRPRADHEAERIVGRRGERRSGPERAADARVGRRHERPDERATFHPGALQRQDGAHEERHARHRTERIARLGHDDRLADGRRAGHGSMRGSTSRSARATSSGKSISVHGIPSTRSKPTTTRSSSSG